MERLWLFITSKEGIPLVSSELRALCEIYSKNDFELKQIRKNLFLVKGNIDAREIANRSSFVNGYGIVFATINDKYEELFDLREEFKDIETFAIRLGENCKGKNYLIDIAWSKIKGMYPDTKVDLSKPKSLVHIISYDKIYFAIGDNIAKKGWADRRPRLRPFFHPSALYPKLARILINLSRVRKGEVLIDPFCGTGSILIESRILGINAVGMDLNLRMCKGCKKNLDFFSLPISLVRGDARYLPFSYVDAIATDSPYGRCSSTYGIKPSELLTQFLDSLKGIIKRGGYCVILHSKDVELKHACFTLVEQHDIYVHRNLTRRISVIRRD